LPCSKLLLFNSISKNHKKSEKSTRRSHFDAYNLHLLLLKVPQILKTGPTLNFGNFRLANLIFNWPPFENKLKMKVPFQGFIPTNKNWSFPGWILLGSVF
jgi:hypothetical protein